VLTPLSSFGDKQEDAGTDFADVDGCNIRPQAKAQGAKALPVRADAGTAVPLQPGLRGMRQKSNIPRTF